MNTKLIKYTYKILPKKVFWEKFKVKILKKIGFKYNHFYDFDFNFLNSENFVLTYNNDFFSDFLESLYQEENNFKLDNQSKSIEIINNFCNNKINIFGQLIELKDTSEIKSNFYNFNTDFINNFSWSEQRKYKYFWNYRQ